MSLTARLRHGRATATAATPSRPASIDTALRLHLVGVVLSNVVFVHVTDVLSARWLAALYGLCVATPLVVPLQQRLAFRLSWNAAVLAIFTLLVHHASHAGVRFLLEDGLILAAFCQVHLLHNLGPRQRPDLLFFNSFLIALVTSFFCQAAVYAVVFATYALLLVAALVRASAASHGGPPPPGLLLDATRKAVLSLGSTTVLFLVLPRDFHREGLVADRLATVAGRQVGFSEEVRLGRSEHTVSTDRVAMKLKLTAGVPGDVPQLWRGASLVDYDNGRWRPSQPGSSPLGQTPWEQRRPGTWTKSGPSTLARVEVELADRHLGHVFAPLATTMVALVRAGDALVVPRSDGTLLALPGASADDGPLRYDVAVGRRVTEAAAQPPPPLRPELRPWLHLPPGALPAPGRRLAEAIAAQHQGAAQHELVEALRRVLAANFDYLPPGTRGAAADLAEFLAGEAGGHCEYFATALALMLRSRGVPCRLATGWLVHGWDYETGTCVVHTGDAHAWVEVLDPAGFWYAVDATPPATAQVATTDGLWGWMLHGLRSTWDKVTGFDGAARSAALQWLLTLPARLLGLTLQHWFAAAVLAAAAAWTWWRKWRRRAPPPPSVQVWQRAVARCGLQPEPSETPRELLARAARTGVAADRIQALATATAHHERARYAGGPGPRAGNPAAGTPYAG